MKAVLDTNVYVSALHSPGGVSDRVVQLARHQQVQSLISPSILHEEDESDNRILECAVAAKAEIIVSGDRHLRDLGEFRGIRILSPAEFLATLKR